MNRRTFLARFAALIPGLAILPAVAKAEPKPHLVWHTYATTKAQEVQIICPVLYYRFQPDVRRMSHSH